MSNLDRDEILSNFQTCTGMEDVGEAMLWLEEAGWDLWTAIKNAVPQDSQQLPSEFVTGNNIVGNYPVQNGEIPVTLSDDFMDDASTSDAGPLVPLNIHFNDAVITVFVPERMKLTDLKTLLYAKTGVSVCSQMISGWDIEPLMDDDRISTSNYPSDGKLVLTEALPPPVPIPMPIPIAIPVPMDFERDEHVSMYTLQVIDESKCKDYSLQLPGTRTIRQVKHDVYEITDIEPQSQLWIGWPPNISDNTRLCDAELNLPTHTLSVRSCKVFIDLMDSDDSSPEEFEDASETFTVEDEMFVDEMPRRAEPLIPEDIEDEATGAVHFAEGFSRRYGQLHPEFFAGSLEGAIKEACLKPAKDRRLLAIYLHHDRSVLANVFCTELLCFESVLQTLAAYFVIWGWDITQDVNRSKFLASVTQSLGVAVASTIRSIQLDNLPALIIITRSRSNTELFNVINGNIGVSELLTMLIHAVDVYGDMKKAEMKEEEERNKRELIKIEQDQAFQQSLLADRAKDEAKRQQELLAVQEKERIEKERIEIEEKKEAERLAVKSKLPDEPAENAAEHLIKIRFRCPGGGILQRRFLGDHELNVLFNYLHVEGFHTDDYKVILSWPRRDLTTVNPKSSLLELKLHPQEMVILEER